MALVELTRGARRVRAYRSSVRSRSVRSSRVISPGSRIPGSRSRALWDGGGNHTRARELATQAVAEIDAWLSAHR